MLDITEDVIDYRRRHIGASEVPEGYTYLDPAGVYVFDTPEEADSILADDMEEVLQTAKPREGLILSTGSSYENIYDTMAKRRDRFARILQKLILINQDELRGIQENDPRSYRTYMRRKLFDRFPELREENWIIPNSVTEASESLRVFIEQLRTVRSIKLAMLGIGPDGDPEKGLEASPHIAFIRANTAMNVLAEIVDLDERTRHANSGGAPENYPVRAITHGPANILRAQEIFLLAKGPSKRQNMKRVLLDKFDLEASATLVQIAALTMGQKPKPRVTHYLDREAAGLTLSTIF